MRLTFASYNIHKAVGLDRRRNPERIIEVLREIDADIVALQEADRRFGRRASALPLSALEQLTDYKPIPIAKRPDSIGWHGNALLVRRDIIVAESAIVPLPMLEPRGAIRANLIIGGKRIRVIGMHLDLSGLHRRGQIRTVLHHLADCPGDMPEVLMGDLNEWSRFGGALREFGDGWRVLSPGRSFPSRRPVAQLDRIVVSPAWRELSSHVHHSALAARASDHLPVVAHLDLPNF